LFYFPPFSFERLPVRWDDAKIVVMDDVVISPPYNIQDCDAPQPEGAGKARLERVRKVLDGERGRLLKTYPELEEEAKRKTAN
jgi:hypothetical protein